LDKTNKIAKAVMIGNGSIHGRKNIVQTVELLFATITAYICVSIFSVFNDKGFIRK